MAKPKEPNYFLVFFGGMILTLILHYFLISRFNLHPTLHVFISLVMFWLLMAIISMIQASIGRR